MKYSVKYSCGHICTVELFGKTSERERKIRWMQETAVCPECYKEQKRIELETEAEKAGLVPVTMSYKEYKDSYPDCDTVPGSYDGLDKTIEVYVKKG